MFFTVGHLLFSGAFVVAVAFATSPGTRAERPQPQALGSVQRGPTSSLPRPDTSEGTPTQEAGEGPVSGRGMNPRRLQEAAGAVCTGTGADEQKEVTIGEYTLEGSFTCGQGQTLSPPCNDRLTTAYDGPECAHTQELSALFKNKGGELDNQDGYTVALKDMPANRDGKAYYKCGDSNGSNKCVVTVKLPPQPGPSKSTTRHLGRHDLLVSPVCACNGRRALVLRACRRLRAKQDYHCDG